MVTRENKMTTSKTFIVDVQTGEEIIRDLNADELAQQALDVIEHETKLAEIEQAKVDKAALLAKLGISADEAKLLLS
jgi:hypothetical protein